jgi:hypothetical protein
MQRQKMHIKTLMGKPLENIHMKMEALLNITFAVK